MKDLITWLKEILFLKQNELNKYGDYESKLIIQAQITILQATLEKVKEYDKDLF